MRNSSCVALALSKYSLQKPAVVTFDDSTDGLANYSPAELVTYNIDTQTESTLSDPYGGPVDVAVDKHRNIYALSLANVAIYKPGSEHPTELTCSYLSEGGAIAVNNEGSILIAGTVRRALWAWSNSPLTPRNA